jgi:hypothetical protein
MLAARSSDSQGERMIWLRESLRRVPLVLTFFFVVRAAQAQEQPPAACFPDCRPGFICHEGQCVSACNPPCGESEMCTADALCVAKPAAAPAPAPAPVASAPPPAPNVHAELGAAIESEADDPGFRPPPGISGAVLRINALSVLQFGLDPTLELGSRGTFILRARLMNSGLLSHIVAADPSDDETFSLGIGGAAGFRVYTGRRGMHGFYFGGALEVTYIEIEDTEDDLAVYSSVGLIPQGELGYRWVWGHFVFEVGGALGVWVPVSYSAEPSEPGGCVYADSCTDETSANVYGLLHLGLGFLL